MLLELVVFAAVLVILQTLAGVVLMKLLMTKKFIKKYTKMATEVSQEIINEMEFDD